MKFIITLLCLVVPAFQIMSQTVDSITDVRDGQVYKTVKIGSQWWMQENLNVGNRINGVDTMKNNGIIEKYAYNNNEAYADTYGGLYQWDEAMQYDTTEGIQGICPNGWHIPTDAEWKTLEMALGMTQVQADTIGWRGTDQGNQLKVGGVSGFQAQLSGYRHYSSGTFYNLGTYATFWSSSQYDASSVWFRYLISSLTQVFRLNYKKTYGFCVRCLKDEIVPVKISSMNAFQNGSNIVLSWTTQTEQSNLGWNILRATSSNGQFTQINSSLIPGAGTSAMPHSYSYTDIVATAGQTYYYKLEQVDIDGSKEYSYVVSATMDATGIKPMLIKATELSGSSLGTLYSISGQKVLAGIAPSGIYILKNGDGKINKILIIK